MPQQLGQALQSFLRTFGTPERLLLTRLWQHWELVMGPELAGLAWPLGQRNGILLVGGEDAMALQELTLMADEILERANAFMEQPYFTAVKVNLVLGSTVLNNIVLLPASSQRRLDLGPPLTGEFLSTMPADSAVARCYASYVALKRGDGGNVDIQG